MTKFTRRFDLNTKNADDAIIVEWIDELKQTWGKYPQVWRDAFMIYRGLACGDTTRLKQVFPYVETGNLVEHSKQVVEGMISAEQRKLKAEREALQAERAELDAIRASLAEERAQLEKREELVSYREEVAEEKISKAESQSQNLASKLETVTLLVERLQKPDNITPIDTKPRKQAGFAPDTISAQVEPQWVADIRAQMDSVKASLDTMQVNTGANSLDETQAMKPVGLKPVMGGGAKQLNVPQFTAPSFDDDDDDDLLVVKKDTSCSNANANFLQSLQGLLDMPISGNSDDRRG